MDAVVIVTDHSGIDYEWIVRQCPLTVDTRNVTKGMKQWKKKIVNA
jgi:UDP-N-acetyl-D-mannosaminuronate dehydrogenase